MKEDNLELVEYLDGKFKKVEDDFNDLKKDFNALQTSVDAYANKADTYFQEMAMLTLKVNRHEKWLEKVAEKLGMKLEY
ncbi:MAG: hypothetical protein A3C58_03010 [Candidatus Staskawiczbacteria bacterium RIFCSPHIGHO2_02_FULL_34_10]|uniref:Uncharacterized protein n=2 Tax=Candidatus Staskawicziibacteriota TaxID=1817916 RepID=A0A1G2HIQ3_9BACT|nr:MAG: hypothetical protein A2639_00890 [Candidatus Staskawiczbacteria bacterium RIFCSPHIGHO2_01_FULL_34_27]OGZ67765.1 MAG: hypothetical protein A3C58_03010 [Candidatus Staskawiczbacteria bacterium RIFCSPHIGHO2_02_FULL_34_10]